jgi:hypothetical protein
MTLPAGNDDTIELMLTPEQMLGLSKAAEAAAMEPPAPAAPLCPVTVVAPTPILGVEGLPHALRWHQTPLAKMAANTLMFVAFVWWSVSQLAGQPQARPPVAVAAVGPLAVVHHAPPIAAPEPPPVQVVNPFDKTEIFQFPAGTSNDESREKVAQLLLQRARERQSHWIRAKSENSLRTASLAPIRKSSGPGT